MSIFQVEKRTPGAEKTKQLRNRGFVPMALVERSHETLPIQASVVDLRRALSHLDSHGRLEFKVGDEKGSRFAIVKQLEQDPLAHHTIHLTLQEVADDDMVKVDVPVVATGHSSETEATGVNLQVVTDHIKVKGKMVDIPEKFEVDVSNLKVGEHIAASDIELAEGLELLSAADATLFAVTVMRGAVETTEGSSETEAGSAESSE